MPQVHSLELRCRNSCSYNVFHNSYWFLGRVLHIFAQFLFTKLGNLSEIISETFIHAFLSQLGVGALLGQVGLAQINTILCQFILIFCSLWWCFGFLLYIFAQLLFTKPVNLSENVSATLVHSFLSQLGAWRLLDQVGLYQKVLYLEQFCIKFIVPSKPNWFRWGRPHLNIIAWVFFSKPGVDPKKLTWPDHFWENSYLI